MGTVWKWNLNKEYFYEKQSREKIRSKLKGGLMWNKCQRVGRGVSANYFVRKIVIKICWCRTIKACTSAFSKVKSSLLIIIFKQLDFYVNSDELIAVNHNNPPIRYMCK